jgi:carbamoyltransferase
MSEFSLGINCHAHDSSAALLQDGRVIFASTEERFSRIKKDRSFPRLTIQAALDHAGIGFDNLGAVAFGWNRPGLGPLHTIRQAVRGQLPLTPGWTLTQLYHMASEIRHAGGLRPLREKFGPVARDRVFYIDHHESHAWSAYALSGMDDALVLVMDGWGAWQSTTIYHGRDGRLKVLKVFPYPNSLGVLYEAFTDLLGFERQNDEWKVMGLAAYGQPTVDLSDVIRITPTGYRVNSKLLSGRSYGDLSAMTAHFGPRRDPEKHIADADRDLAASVQQATEQAIFALVREGVRLTGSRSLCLAGGVAMNSKANGRVLASGLIDRIFIQPAATDDGAAVGAAFGAYRAMGREVPRSEMADAYLGPEYSDAEIEQTLRTFKLPVVRVPDVAAVTARLLAEGKIAGWFQGRMEFGPRALGNRSILADARDPAMKDRVNECVKFREGWRPFAPSCLAERAGEYFTPDAASPFMILTQEVRQEKRSVIPAVTHADQTARVQTVRRDVNPRYWELIREFDKLTGVPVVMNTSFNLRGEPIVCTPKDAIRTFFSSGLDLLVLGNFIVAKSVEGQERIRQMVGQPAVSSNGVHPAEVAEVAVTTE